MSYTTPSSPWTRGHSAWVVHPSTALHICAVPYCVCCDIFSSSLWQVAQNSLSSSLEVPLLHALSHRESLESRRKVTWTGLIWTILKTYDPSISWSEFSQKQISVSAVNWPHVQSGTSFRKVKIPPQSSRNGLSSDIDWWNKWLGKPKDWQSSFR